MLVMIQKMTILEMSNKLTGAAPLMLELSYKITGAAPLTLEMRYKKIRGHLHVHLAP